MVETASSGVVVVFLYEKHGLGKRITSFVESPPHEHNIKTEPRG